MTPRRPIPGRTGHDDSGQVAVEYLGALPYLLLAILAVLQLTFTMATLQGASAAARAGARAASQGDSADGAARSAVPGWLRGKLNVSVNGGTDPEVAVSVPLPIVMPGFDGPTVTRKAWFEAEQRTSPWG